MGVPIKPAFGPNSDPTQKDKSPQAYREHLDLIRQLNAKMIGYESRLAELEARLKAGYVLAQWRGVTVVGANPVTAKATNLRLSTSTVNSIDFFFTDRRPITPRYTALATNQDGTGSFSGCSITANTLNGFRLRPLTGGAIFNPQSAVVEVEIIIIESP